MPEKIFVDQPSKDFGYKKRSHDMPEKFFVDQLSKDKVFLLSMLEDPTRTLQEYDYRATDETIQHLVRIRVPVLRLIAEILNQKTELQRYTQDESVVISMLTNPAKTFRKFKIPGRPELIFELDDLVDKLLEHIATIYRVGIGPLADNNCDACNACP